jgi:hypothetical protein
LPETSGNGKPITGERRVSESSFRQALLQGFRRAGVAAVAIEGAAEGTPDVAWRDGWLELKVVAGWPKAGGDVRVEHFTREQLLWGAGWTQGGGRWGLLVRVGGHGILLFDIYGAVVVKRGAGRREWEMTAVAQFDSVGEAVGFIVG